MSERNELYKDIMKQRPPIPLPMVFGDEGTGQSNWVGLW